MRRALATGSIRPSMAHHSGAPRSPIARSVTGRVRSRSGEPMSAKLLAALGAIADRTDAAYVRVGFLEDATSPEGIPEAQIAFWNEFGKDGSEGEPKQPPRPFFRRMIAEVTPEISGWTESALAFTDMDGVKALELLGKKLQDALVESIQKL